YQGWQRGTLIRCPFSRGSTRELLSRDSPKAARAKDAVARNSSPRAPIRKRVIIEDRKTDRDPMLPAFHVDGGHHDIPHSAFYPARWGLQRRVRRARAVQFEACIGLDATFPERVIVGDDTISYGESQKRNLPSCCPGTSCPSTVWEKRHASAAVSPKKRNP